MKVLVTPLLIVTRNQQIVLEMVIVSSTHLKVNFYVAAMKNMQELHVAVARTTSMEIVNSVLDVSANKDTRSLQIFNAILEHVNLMKLSVIIMETAE